MKNKYKRIFITGASGTGKTTLARMVSEITGFPFLPTSAKEIWPEFNFKNHSDALRASCLDPEVGYNYQHEILKRRVKALHNQKHFVSDRSPFDNYAYFLIQNSFMNGELQNEMFRTRCEDNLYLADALIFLRLPDNSTIEDDGFRIANADYQRMVDATIELSIRKCLKHTMPVLEISSWDLEEKIKLVTEFLQYE